MTVDVWVALRGGRVLLEQRGASLSLLFLRLLKGQPWTILGPIPFDKDLE